MIQLRSVTKHYHTRSGRNVVLDAFDLTIRPGEKVGIIGRNGAGKSTLIRILSGVESCDQGEINRGMKLSWPLAFGGAFQGSLTGLDNLKFICRVYGVPYATKIDYVQDFAELGPYFLEPVKTYSAGMRARLSFAISMAVEFDCYLIDEIFAVGDSRFQQKCHDELFVKRGDAAMVIVSHHPAILGAHCETYYVLEKGKLLHFDNCDAAHAYYNSAKQ
jgi:capsular polysaccharide transport system ATP-binding protein